MARPASIRSYHTDYFSLTRSSSSRPVDLTPSLSQATEFRVPTHDAPQKVTSPRGNAPVPHAMHSQWERDSNANECRSCHKRFTFYFRKVSVSNVDVAEVLIWLFNFDSTCVLLSMDGSTYTDAFLQHCRRCGKVFCNGCSLHRALLDPSEVVIDPGAPEDRHTAPTSQRVCQSCYDEVSTDVPGPLRSSRGTGMEGLIVNNRSLAVPAHMRRGEDTSQISDLTEFVFPFHLHLTRAEVWPSIPRCTVAQCVAKISVSLGQSRYRNSTSGIVSREVVVLAPPRPESTSYTGCVSFRIEDQHREGNGRLH
jgi:hypothetical protein